MQRAPVATDIALCRPESVAVHAVRRPACLAAAAAAERPEFRKGTDASGVSRSSAGRIPGRADDPDGIRHVNEPFFTATLEVTPFPHRETHSPGADAPDGDTAPADLRHVIVERDQFKIRLADTDGQRSSSSLLIKRMYAWRGYDTAPPADATSNVVTLVAHTNDAAERAIGTLTLWFDAADGLPADAAYADKLDQLRCQDRRLCEPGSLAVDAAALGSRPLLAALFHLVYMYARNIRDHTDLVIQVNPRHGAFYQRMMGFTQIGEARICPKVNAPAVLLRVTTEHMQAEIERCGGSVAQGHQRSLYPYFFSSREEQGLTGRLWGQDGHRGADRSQPP